MNLQEAQATIAFQADQIRRMEEQRQAQMQQFTAEHRAIVAKLNEEIAELKKAPATPPAAEPTPEPAPKVKRARKAVVA